MQGLNAEQSGEVRRLENIVANQIEDMKQVTQSQRQRLRGAEAEAEDGRAARGRG